MPPQEMYKGLKVEVERVPFNDEAYDMSLFKLRDQVRARARARARASPNPNPNPNPNPRAG